MFVILKAELGETISTSLDTILAQVDNIFNEDLAQVKQIAKSAFNGTLGFIA